MTEPPTAAVVAVKSAWWSKVNWLQVVGSVATLVTTNAFGLDDHTQVEALAIVNIVQGVATIVTKTWFTPTVISNSLSSERAP